MEMFDEKYVEHLEELSYNDLIKRGAEPFVNTKGKKQIITRAFCSECHNFLSQEEIDTEKCNNCQSEIIDKQKVKILQYNNKTGKQKYCEIKSLEDLFNLVRKYGELSIKSQNEDDFVNSDEFVLVRYF